jgi:hypothetical protein
MCSLFSLLCVYKKHPLLPSALILISFNSKALEYLTRRVKRIVFRACVHILLFSSSAVKLKVQGTCSGHYQIEFFKLTTKSFIFATLNTGAQANEDNSEFTP